MLVIIEGRASLVPRPRYKIRKECLGTRLGASLIERDASTQMNDAHSGLKLYPWMQVSGCRHEEIMPA